MNSSADLQLYETCTSLPTMGEQLLPGIPNEITLDCIAPKLSWRVFHALSLVSRRWSDAVRTRQIYYARVRTHSTERLVLVTHIRIGDSKNGIAIYSTKDKFCFPLLPPIPDLLKGIPRLSQCAALDGKVYVLGGILERGKLSASDKVYVLDLVGQRQWKECASMKEPRFKFGCGVKHGKIYVFGGITGNKRPCESEVYDPKENVWSPVRGMASCRYGHEVKSVGEELFVSGGTICHRDNLPSTAMVVQPPRHIMAFPLLRNPLQVDWTSSSDIYHPVKDEWRVSNSFRKHRGEALFVARGKFHSMSKHGIYVKNVEENSWTFLHPILSLFHPVFGSASGVLRDVATWSQIPLVTGVHGSTEATLLSVQEVYDELLAIVSCNVLEGRETSSCLVQSRGFGGQTEEILWHKAQFTFFFTSASSTLVPIEL